MRKPCLVMHDLSPTIDVRMGGEPGCRRITGYEAILDTANNIVGIYYVGYLKE
jgi:hypothetical protein